MTVRVWDTKTWKCLHHLEGHTEPCLSAALSHDAKWIASATKSEIWIWASDTGVRENILKSSGKQIYSVQFSPDATLVASSEHDDLAQICKKDGRIVQTLKIDTQYEVSATFSPEGKLIASASTDYSVTVWLIGTDHPHRVLQGHVKPVTVVVFSDDSLMVASASWDSG